MKLGLKTGSHNSLEKPKPSRRGSSPGQGEFGVGNRTGSVKLEGWQLQWMRDCPCQSTNFVARLSGFHGNLLLQPEHSVLGNFCREIKIFKKQSRKRLPSALLVFLSTQYCHLQLTDYYRFLYL